MRLRLRTLIPALALGVLVGASAGALEWPTWSAGGNAVLGVVCTNSGVRVIAVDAATGATEWSSRIVGRRTDCRKLRRRGLEILPSDNGDAALVVVGERLLWASSGAERASEMPLRRVQLEGLRLSPDGQQLAFLRHGDLWAISIADRRETRLTAGLPIDGDSHSARSISWSPDSRTIALLTGGRVALIDLLAPSPRFLDAPLAAPGRPGIRSIFWRFDGRALVLLAGADDEGFERLSLCHAERLYCRPLADRPALGEEAPANDFQIFADGFSWAERAADGGVGLAWFDTLGRRRSALTPQGTRVVEIAAALFDAKQLVVATRSAGGDPATDLAWLLIDPGRRGSPEAIQIEPGVRPLFSPATGHWLSLSARNGRIVAESLKTLDGREIADLPPAGD